MFRKLLIGVFVLGICLFIVNIKFDSKIEAGGGCDWEIGSTLSASKTAANIGEEITLTLKLFCSVAPDLDLNNIEVEFSTSDSGVTTSPDNGCTNSGGVYSTKVTATTPGTKTIQAWNINGTWKCGEVPPEWGWHHRYSAGSISLNFVNESQSPSNTETTKTTSQKLSAPAISTINGNQLPENKTYDKVIRQGQPITFSGKTSVNSTVKLYIYSDPVSAEVKSDKDGNWAYALTQELAVGEHKVEAEVTDASSKTSDKVEIAKFTILDKITPVESAAETSILAFIPFTYGLIGLVIILAGVLTYLIIKRRKLVKLSTPPSTLK